MARTILEDWHCEASSILRYGGRYWLFTRIRNHLRLFYTDDVLHGDWSEHPESPLDKHVPADRRRMAGRPVVYNDDIIRCVAWVAALNSCGRAPEPNGR
jgi:hypothetical protein